MNNGLYIQEYVSLAQYSTFHIGGAARYFIEVTTHDMLRDAVRWAQERSLSITILGGGSNMLIDDKGIEGLVIHIACGGITYEEQGDTVIARVGAGEVFDAFVSDAVARGYWGLENLSAIPGSVGATPVQNVGAYGVEVASLIQSVRVFDLTTSTERVLVADECAFTYRDSIFKRPEGRTYVVTEVTFYLSNIPRPNLTYKDLLEKFGANEGAPTLRDIRDAVIAIRKKKFPDWTVVGTAGSFFKNPIISQADFDALRGKYPDVVGYMTEGGVKVALGWILEHVLNLRGYREGNVGTYEGQALVVVAYKGATAHDVEHFAHMIEQKVFDATTISIEWEVTHVA